LSDLFGVLQTVLAQSLLWEKGDLRRKLWPQQRVIYDRIQQLPRNVQTAVLLCARQFGKSVLICLLALEDCLKNKNVVVMIIGPTIKQTRAIARPRIKLLASDSPPGLIKHMKSEDTWHFSNGSELVLGGFDSNSAGQRGKTLHKIYIEETRDSKPDDYDNFLRSDLGPALTHSKHAQIIHATTLPGIPDHPFITETIPDAELNGALYKFTIDDNKQLSPEQYAACVKICRGKHTIAFRVEYLCEMVRDSSIIIAPEFNEELHVKEISLPPYLHYWVGGDTGGVRDSSCFHLLAYDFVRDKVLFLDERFYKPETGSDLMAKEVKAMEKKWAGQELLRWVDAPGQLQVDFSVQHGFLCTLPSKDGLEASVNLVRVALTECSMEISPKCKMLIATLRSGTFNKTRTDFARTKTLGHMDAFMSACYSIRHADKMNPYPAYGGATSATHYIGEEDNQDVQTVKNLFGG